MIIRKENVLVRIGAFCLENNVISNAEQIQTEISDVYPASNHFICSCVSVEIEYYTENGVNIATKLTSNGQEIAPLYFKE